MSGGGSANGYVIERSLRFNAASSQYLSRTPSVAGNRKTWTLSTWVKRGALGTDQGILAANDGVAGGGSFGFASDNTFFLTLAGVGTQKTSALFRDVGAHYHVVIDFDSTQAVQADRFIVYINNIQYLFTSNLVALNTDYAFNNNVEHKIGTTAVSGGTTYKDGYLSEYNFVNAQRLNPSFFGEINQTTGQWVAKKYTGTYGTNGFYLDFKDGTSTTTLGYDTAGSNDWTLTNFTRSAGVNDCWMRDVPAGNGSASSVQPSGNYAVLNPLNTNGGTFSKANLFYTAPSAWRASPSTILLPSTGKIYVEATLKANPGSGFAQIYAMIGVIAPSAVASWSFNSASSFYVADTGDYVNYTSGSAGSFAGNAANTVLALLIDRDANQVAVYQNNTSVITVTLGIASGVELYIFNCNYDGTRGAMDINFGQRSFAYTPPAGFKALCTANLPTPTVKNGADHFNVQLSTGANIKTDSEALFINELVWIKDRANANNHQLIDSVRGSTAVLQSNTTAAETTYTAPSGSSVGWVWRASDSSPVTNNNGSISSQVSANVAAGFSIVTYTGTGVTASVGHGLGVAPKLIIIKKRTAGTADIWIVGNSTSGWNNFLQLELTNALAASNGPFNSTAPSSSVFTLGTSTATNQNTSNFVAYCFAEIAGYSKFGSYTGNGSADGTNVTLGFKPAFVMIKRTDTTSNWTMFDNQRDGYNVDNDQLYANTTGAEVTTDLMDLLSNGFKSRSSDASINANGGTYIYWAFAETPFQYANAR